MSRLTQVPNSSLSRISLTGLSPSAADLSRGVLLSVALDFVARSFYPDAALPQLRFGLLRVRSPLLAQSLLFSFPPGIEMFQFPGLASRFAERHALRAGLPHSDIRGSKGICPSPRLFAACHVLLRLREPRHPSCALLSFPFFLLGKVAFFRACTAVMTALRASFTEGLFALEFCLVARIYFLYLRALAQSPALVLQCVFAVFTASSMSMYSFPCLFQVVPGRVELPTSTLSV